MVENNKILSGRDLILFTVISGATVPVAFANSVSLSFTVTTREIKSKDNVGDYPVRFGDTKDYNISVDSLLAYNLSGTSGSDIIFDLMDAKQPISFYFGAKTGTSPEWTLDTTVTHYSGSVIITKFDIKAGESDNATYTFSGDAAGPLSKVKGI